MPAINRCPVLFLSFAASLMLLATGCGGKDPGRPETAKVTGTVKYNGNTVAGATVTFVPAASLDRHNQAEGKAAFAMTDDSGAYSLRTFDPDDGALPGSYIVTVTKFPSASAASVPDVDSSDYNPDDSEAPPAPPKNELPAKYETIKTSDLKAEVKSGTENVVPLELKD
jgi:hypothetical protein